MQWLTSIFHRDERQSAADPEAFARREASLRQRLMRLEQEVDVIQRADTDEEPQQ